jgi:hypothetical protein
LAGRDERPHALQARHTLKVPQAGRRVRFNVMAHLTIRLVTKQGRVLQSVAIVRVNGVGGMALDPESQRLLDLMAAANRPAWNTLSPEAARELYLSLRPAAQGPRPADVKVVDAPSGPRRGAGATIARPRHH